MTPTLLVRVAVNAPLREALTYSVPTDLIPQMLRGASVEVSLGKRRATGVILGPAEPVSEDIQIKSVSNLIEDRPLLPEPYVKWLSWVADYYAYHPGPTMDLCFPPLKRAGRKTTSNVLSVPPSLSPRPELTADQARIVESILSQNGFFPHLLFGVTGSGKTEVYLRLLEQKLAEGKKGLVLVPEISLTPQLLSRFIGRFGDRIAILHSGLSDRDRTNQWWDIVSGKKDILIGARSALFCPIADLGLIIVDEEHEGSFKQDEKLKYHGRDSALMLARELNIPIVLGSATPSLESWQNALSGKYQLHRMPTRATAIEMPEVRVIDLKASRENKTDESRFWASPELLEAIQRRLENKEQVAMFLNRRGIAQSVVCPGCGWRKVCPNCDINLTLHAKTHLVCHYCDYRESLPESCDSCHQFEFKPLGLGTELVESELRQLFPDARVIRADRDEINSREEMEDFVRQVERREVDILVGTQMIAKGLDFPGLTLVGVVLADIAMNLPDFRAAERAHQLLSQVSGRAGRHQTRGEVLIQTYNPDHPAIVFAQKHDFEGFCQAELQTRQELGYPPFGKLALLRLQGLDRQKVSEASESLATKLDHLSKRNPTLSGLEILGPAEAPIFRVRNNYRYHLLLKAPKTVNLSRLAKAAIATKLPPGVRLLVDIDPINML